VLITTGILILAFVIGYAVGSLALAQAREEPNYSNSSLTQFSSGSGLRSFVEP
jgi:hypothetical protein